MSDTSKLRTCQMVCWGLAGLTGLIVALASTRSMAVILSLLLGIAVAAVLGVLLRWLVCTDYPSDDRGIGPQDIVRGLRNLTGITGYKAPPEQASVMEVAMGRTSRAAAADTAPAAEKPAKTAPSAASASATAVKSGATLEGGTAPAERKGAGHSDAANDAGQTSAGVDASIGVKPSVLSAPKGGQADHLQQIKGVGPKLEQACNDLGIYHFDQIAAWGPDEVAWVDENLVGFKGRVSRDDWVTQAKTLAAGGETEFSKRVAKDDAQ